MGPTQARGGASSGQEAVRQQDVLWLDVAVNDVALIVDVVHRVEQLGAQGTVQAPKQEQGKAWMSSNAGSAIHQTRPPRHFPHLVPHVEPYTTQTSVSPC